MATKAESTTSGMGDTLNGTAQNVKDKIADFASTAKQTASATGRRSRSRRPHNEDRADVAREYRRGTEVQKSKALEKFDTIKGAMIGVAANTFKGLLGQLIPGFHEQFEKTAQEKRAGGVSGASSTPTLSSSNL